MSKKLKIVLGVLVAIGVIVAAVLYLRSVNVEVLNPKGTIAHKQRDLIIFAASLSLFVVIPVYTLAFTFMIKYKETNKNATYAPEWDGDKRLESIWWGIPITLILILSIVTWNSSHALDPFKPLNSTAKPLEVEVVALQWKWLFIYPEQHVATVNYAQIPIDRPVNFTITSDAPMNSFWIPQLGGQIYAMSGMSTQLHLMATEVGSYNGSSANISGAGFAGMTFKMNATNQSEFDNWVTWAHQSQDFLNTESYAILAQPSENNWPATYAPVDPGLYDTIIAKYMLHPALRDDHVNENAMTQMSGG
jgi:cytochrome o ubiquinol oxidase subunit 2